MVKRHTSHPRCIVQRKAGVNALNSLNNKHLTAGGLMGVFAVSSRVYISNKPMCTKYPENFKILNLCKIKSNIAVIPIELLIFFFVLATTIFGLDLLFAHNIASSPSMNIKLFKVR